MEGSVQSPILLQVVSVGPFRTVGLLVSLLACHTGFSACLLALRGFRRLLRAQPEGVLSIIRSLDGGRCLGIV